MPFCDLHVHSKFSFDGYSTIDEICANAVSVGLKTIAFTEHLDMDPDYAYHQYLDYGEYSKAIERARAAHGKKLTILKGLEMDYQSRLQADIESYLREHHFDVVIGSVHVLEGKFVDTEFFAGRS